MVAYSFKSRFIEPIITGAKTQTIRAATRKRHARIGEELQLYTAMRTKQCRLIGRAVCVSVAPIRINVADSIVELLAFGRFLTRGHLTRFAQSDGFPDWHGSDGMRAFWLAEHGDIATFEGVLIRWRDLVVAA